ncbi:hypothetical protein WA026_011706 [Henosepilachna vigintioctopunctata]|uniref:Uncharacterized protein n=1 Tax=Henosepilachna vigintioctopunctata TaxID=420089 RepID=A0AAW1UK62_9CUCU
MEKIILATCSKDLKLYNWPGITPAGIFETLEDCVSIRAISWCNDGKSLVAIKSKDQPLIVSLPFQGEKKLEPSYLKNLTARACAFANTSDTSVAFGDGDGSVCIYDLRKKRKITEYRSTMSSVNYVDFSRDDTCLAVGCANGQILLYAAGPKPCAAFAVPDSRTLSAMRFDAARPDLLAAGSKEGVVGVWNATRGASIIAGKDHEGSITDLEFFGENITTIGTDGKLIIYDIRSSDYTSCYNLNASLSSIAYAPGSSEIVIGTSDGQLRCYDRRYMTTPINTVIAYDGVVKMMRFRPSLVAATRVTDNSKCQRETVVKPPPASAGDFNPDFSPSSSTIMSIAGDMKDLENVYLHEMLPPSASQIGLQKNEVTYEEFDRLASEMDDYLKQHKRKIEDRMLAEFYQLRIEMSKQFIELQDKINKSWDGFMQYLKLSNEEARSERSSEAQTFKHAASEIKSSKTRKSKKMS